MSYGSKKSEGGPQKAEVPPSDDAQQASPLFFKLPFLPQNGADGETRTLVGQCPAVYETAAVATEPHRRNGGSPRICTVFHPGKSRSFTIKVCDPRRGAKAELNRRSQACEVLAGTGISRRVKWSERRVALPLTLAPDASASLLGYALWTGMRVARPLFRFGRPACISQHLCPEKWNPVLELHPPLRFCKPPPELLGQRDRN